MDEKTTFCNNFIPDKPSMPHGSSENILQLLYRPGLTKEAATCYSN